MTELRESLVSDKPPLTSLLIIICVVFIGFMVVGPMIGLLVAMGIYDGDLLSDVAKNTFGPDAFVPLMLVQAATSFIGLILLPMLYVRYTENKSLNPFFKKEHNLALSILLTCSAVICLMIAISPITEWNMSFEFPDSLKVIGDWAREQEDKLAEMTRFMTKFESPGSFLLALFVIAVLAGVGEEFVFRGLIQNELWRSSGNIHLAIWVSAILFSAFHLQFFGFVPRVLLGALFGYLYYWSGNLWIPIIGHFFNNGFLLTMVYLQSLGVSDINMEENTSAPISLIAVCAVASFALLYFFKKQYSTPEQPS